MTKNEITKLFTLVSVLYPRDKAFADATPEMVLAWHTMLEDVPFEAAQAGLQAHASMSQWPPSIAEIRQWVNRLHGDSITADDAWGIAIKGIRKYGYYNKALAQENIQPDVWAVIDRMGYEDMCMSDNTDVLRGQFLRLWGSYMAREQERASLPKKVKVMITMLGDSPLQLGD